jgi:4-amino-4-deoxy-L-arabinose transferase-like glycosyltransferase
MRSMSSASTLSEPRYSGRDDLPRGFLSAGLAALLAAVVLLPLLGHKPLAEWDEGIYAEVSREMLQRGWLIPHWNGEVWLEKPPLMLWITAVFFKAFGVSELWARAGSALSGVALVGLLHGWLEKRKGNLTAWLSTLILLSTFGFLRVCRVGETDALLSLGCCIALIGLTDVDECKGTGWYLFWGGIAIAVMTKGAAGVVIPLAALLFAVLQRWRVEHFSKALWLGFLGFMVLVLPWHIAMYRLFGERFLSEYLGLHVLARATGQIEGHTSHWWYYFWVLLASAAPFVLLYPLALYDLWRRAELRAWVIFAVVVVGFFTVVQTRLPHYIAPAYPALAVITAVFLGERLRPFVIQRRPASFWIKWATIGVPLCVASVLLTAPMRRGLRETKLSDGMLLQNNTESILLLKDVFSRPQSMGGPLLVWRAGPHRSIATDVFYAGRPVQLVELLPVSANQERDKYLFDPEPLGEAVMAEPRLILLNKSLVAQIPAEFHYTEIASRDSVAFGSIVRVP